jgi:hypothetical protein
MAKALSYAQTDKIMSLEKPVAFHVIAKVVGIDQDRVDLDVQVLDDNAEILSKRYVVPKGDQLQVHVTGPYLTAA